ncbi:MAG: M2 family metallopeptidase [Polyangiaceae bacterium]
MSAYSSLPRSLRFAIPLTLALIACDKNEPGGSPRQVGNVPSATATTTAPAAATPEEAKAFLAQVDTDLRKLWVARDRAGWVNANFITDDTELLSAAGEEATAEFMTKTILAAKKFDGVPLPPDLDRQMKLLRLGQTVPAPSNAEERSELAQVQTQMGGMYGKGEYCPKEDSKLKAYLAPEKGAKDEKGEPAAPKKCLKLDALSRILKTSRNYEELLEAWVGWHSISPPMKPKYQKYVALGNKGAKEIGFADLGALWRSGYDMTPEAFEADLERLWQQVKPLYDELHCYMRMKLRGKYGKERVPEHAPIPAHLLGNMWAQEWNNVYDLAEPYKGEGSLDVDKKLKEKKYDAVKMVKLGESFFTSMGMDPLPETFWQRSLFLRPKDREVVCHASAWDVSWNNDLRIKMCIEPTEEDLITIHHELGHDYYFHSYYKLPMLFQQGANDGFHEGIGDTLALAVTPAYLKGLGLLDDVPKNVKAEVNVQMKMAVEKIAFLPFGLLIDKWRWDVFSGKVKEGEWNKAWWDLRTKYQGVSAPVARTESDFDPGAKYHIPGSTPYIRYFLARIYQFQFYKALCEASGHKGALNTCSFFGSKEAGTKLKNMLALGASKPWPEAMKAITGDSKADAAALVEYFAPLRSYLKEQTGGEKCGW